MIHFTQNLSRQRFYFSNTVNFITKKLYSKSMLITRSRKNFYYITTHPEFPPLKINIITLKLDIHQIIEKFIP